MPPRPKVKASGGEPITMSSGVARSTWRGQHSQAASTSRWVCMAALGLPVVPEVKAISAMSSAAVGQAVQTRRTCRRTARASSELPRRPSCIEFLDGGAAPGAGPAAVFQLVQQRAVAERQRGLGLVDDVAEFAGAQQRHGGHRHHAGLDHRQPGQRHADRIATAQQHPVAGHQAQCPRSATRAMRLTRSPPPVRS
jgi:hypothetical protein